MEHWNIEKIQANKAWEKLEGKELADVTVAVIDTGVNYNHPALTSNVWTNTKEIPNDGIDNDNNGYVDDIHGYDFTSLFEVRPPLDTSNSSHGTHVAGIIAANPRPEFPPDSPRGIARNAEIMALKILEYDQILDISAQTHTSRAIRYAVDHEARIINASFGWSGGEEDIPIKEALAYAERKGVLVVTAAGNSTREIDDEYKEWLTSYQTSNLISVANLNQEDLLYDDSNYGRNTVHLGAPGTEINSTVGDIFGTPQYDNRTGTSMAAPHVSGTAALILGQYNALQAKELKVAILHSVDKIEDFNLSVTTGGRLNAYKALAFAGDIAQDFVRVPNPGQIRFKLNTRLGRDHWVTTNALFLDRIIETDGKITHFYEGIEGMFQFSALTRNIPTQDLEGQFGNAALPAQFSTVSDGLSSRNRFSPPDSRPPGDVQGPPPVDNPTPPPVDTPEPPVGDDSLLTAEGSLTVEITHGEQTSTIETTGTGTVSANIGGVDDPLFQGSYTVDEQTGNIAVTEDEEELANDFQLNGLEISIDNIGLSSNQIELQGHVTLPDNLGGLQVAVNGSNKVLIGTDGVSLTGGSVKLPGEQTFNALDLLEIQTHDAELNFNLEEDIIKLQGAFKLPSLNNLTLDLTGDNHIAVKDTDEGLQFEANANVTLDPIAIFGDFELRDITIDLDKGFNETVGSITGQAKLYTSDDNFLDLSLAFEAGRLHEIEAISPEGTDFTWLGADVDIRDITFTPDINPENDDDWEPQLDLQGKLTLPPSLGGLEVDITEGNYISVTEQGISSTGGTLTLPGERTFNALGLLEIQTQDAQLKLDSTQRTLALGGTFVVPSLNNATIDLSGDEQHITIQDTEQGLQFAANADFSVNSIPIFGDFKLEEINVNVDKSFEDSVGSVTGQAKLYTSASKSLELALDFEEGRLKELKATSLEGPDFTWLGAEVDIRQITFTPDIDTDNDDDWEPQLDLQGTLTLPPSLGGLEVDITEDNYISVTEQGISFTGGTLTLPGDRTFNALGLLEIQTQDAQLTLDSTQRTLALGGTFVVPSLNNATLDLSDGKYIRVQDTEQGLQFAANADFSVGSLPIFGDFKLEEISVNVDKSFEDTVGSVTGQAKLYTSETKSIGLTLAVDNQGQLSRIEAKSPEGPDFTWLGAVVDIQDLIFTPDIDTNNNDTWQPQLEFQGSISLPDWLSGAAIQLTGDNKLVVNEADGLSLSGAAITVPDFDFNLLNLLEVKGQDITIEYHHDDDPSERFFKLQGQLSVPSLYNLTADFTGDKHITVSDSGIEVVGSISAQNIVIEKGFWELKDVAVSFDTVNNEVAVTADMLIPAGIEVGAMVDIKDGALESIHLEANNLNKPIGTTGVYLQSIKGGFDHLSSDPIFTGEVDITAGAHFNLSLPSWAGGGFSGSLVELDLSGTIDKDKLTAHGDIQILGGLVNGTGDAELNWKEGYLSATTEFDILDGLITTHTDFFVNSNLDVFLHGEATVGVPRFVPFIGGKTLGEAEVYVEFTNDGNYSNDYVAAWGTIDAGILGRYTAGIRVHFDGDWDLLNGNEAQEIADRANEADHLKEKVIGDNITHIGASGASSQDNTILGTCHPIREGFRIRLNCNIDDTLHGGEGNDLIRGLGGNDNLWGEEHDDRLEGATGNDWLHGGSGEDELYGGEGDDLIHGDDDNDSIWGGSGADLLHGDDGNDLIHGDAGNDQVWGGSGIDLVYGGNGDDGIRGEAGDDQVWGGSGTDALYGNEGNDGIHGDAGNDSIWGGSGTDTLYGGGGDDTIYGDEGNDSIWGGDGNDFLAGDESRLNGSGNENDAANDKIYGGRGNDEIYGFEGNDEIYGEEGNDILYGDLYGSGHDSLNGGSGNDTLVGGGGADVLTGGSGSDRFALNLDVQDIGFILPGSGHPAPNAEFDIITDFQDGVDKLLLSGGVQHHHLVLTSSVLGGTSIRYKGHVIAEVSGISPGQLTSNDFIEVASP